MCKGLEVGKNLGICGGGRRPGRWELRVRGIKVTQGRSMGTRACRALKPHQRYNVLFQVQLQSINERFEAREGCDQIYDLKRLHS